MWKLMWTHPAEYFCLYYPVSLFCLRMHLTWKNRVNMGEVKSVLRKASIPKNRWRPVPLTGVSFVLKLSCKSWLINYFEGLLGVPVGTLYPCFNLKKKGQLVVIHCLSKCLVRIHGIFSNRSKPQSKWKTWFYSSFSTLLPIISL